jgi:hypothetical protein
MPDHGESSQARERGLPRHRERLERQEQAERRQAHREGREHPPRSAEQLDRIAAETARRHDRRNGR